MAKSKTMVSPCHKASIWAARADGVTVGSCSECNEYVCRYNPQTGKPEWLNGESPWTKKKLRSIRL